MDSRTIRRTARRAATALAASALLAGCGSNTPPPDDATSSGGTPTDTVSASADPAGSVVPLEGDRDLRFRWTLGAGAGADDPVVQVSQRIIVLKDLGYGSPSWTDGRRIRKAAASVATAGVVTPREIAQWTDPQKKAATGVERVLVGAPQVHGSEATVFACTNLRGVPAIHGVAHGGTTTRIELVATGGVWRVSSYDNNASTSSAFLERCSTFGDPPNPMLSGG